VDELVLYFAPHLIGGGAPGMFNIPEIANLNAKRKLSIRDVRVVGEDLRVSALFEAGR
jgi:diaminohydroxyphosphoribosylaminopyrimidine deaminase/5-amino-6-(5-phosphoribosylamino)uracil reductase